MLLKIVEVADKTGLSRAMVYRYIRELDNEFDGFVKTGENNAKLFTEEAVAKLQEIKRLKDEEGLGIKEIKVLLGTKVEKPPANEGFAGVDTLLKTMENELKSLRNEKEHLRGKLDEKDGLIKNLLERQHEERQRTDSIIYTLTNQVRDQAVLIEDLRAQHQEVIVPEYETVDAEAVQDNIMDVDAVADEYVQDVVVEMCEEPPAAAAEPARESLKSETQGPAPVMEAVTQPVEPEVQGTPVAVAAEKTELAIKKKIEQKTSHPKHSWGLFKRMWVNMFQPELLRET